MPLQRATCTQYYIHYICGHDIDSEFVKCATHASKEEMRCARGLWQRAEDKVSTHKCRQCLTSDSWCVRVLYFCKLNTYAYAS